MRDHTWLNHPVAYMKTILLDLSWIGASELVLDSSGNGGVAAAKKLAERQ